MRLVDQVRVHDGFADVGSGEHGGADHGGVNDGGFDVGGVNRCGRQCSTDDRRGWRYYGSADDGSGEHDGRVG